MTRILHLIPVDCDFQTAHCAAALQRGTGAEFSIESRSVGAGGDYRNCITAGLALRGVKNHGKGDHFHPDIIHAWGPSALIAAAIIRPARIVYSVPPIFDPRHLRWIGPILRQRATQIVFPSTTLQRVYARRGIPVQRRSVIYPGVDAAEIPAARKTSLRAQLGFAHSDYVILAPGESTRAAGHRDAVWAAAILNCLDPRYRIVVSGNGPQFPAIARFAERLGQPGFFVAAALRLGRPVETAELASAADAAIVAGHGTFPALPILQCMAAGLPIVSSASSTASELLKDRESALLVPRASPRTLAQRILDLQADQSLQARLSSTARQSVREKFTLDVYLKMWTAVCGLDTGSRTISLVESRQL